MILGKTEAYISCSLERWCKFKSYRDESFPCVSNI